MQADCASCAHPPHAPPALLAPPVRPFPRYQQQLAEQQQQKAGGYDARGQHQATAAANLYDQSSGAQNFQALYDQLQGQLKQQQAQQQYRRS